MAAQGGGASGWAALANIASSFLTPENVNALSGFVSQQLTKDGQLGILGKKGGKRGVILLDVQTGLVIGKTSRASALAHLAGRRSSKRRGRTRVVVVESGGKADIMTRGTTVIR